MSVARFASLGQGSAYERQRCFPEAFLNVG
jgi:hypothetical protein